MMGGFEMLSDEWDDDGFSADLAEAVSVFCPYCGEEVEVSIDPAGVGLQEYVEDCQVCCQPWAVRVWVGRDGVPSVTAMTLDES
jgi:hypothetical protein